MPASLKHLALLLLAPALVLVALCLGPDPVHRADHAPLIHREQDFVGSQQCLPCHPTQHASWARTFHRTMTQRADGDTVVGAFDGRTVAFYGQSATPFERDGRFWMTLPGPHGAARTAEVELAVGSRRYQQYFERVARGAGFAYRRLPLVWHIGARRWMHMNGVFLEPDNPDWDQHASTWNKNCIFCHNTGVEPRWRNFPDRPKEADESYDSAVGELGIACEACHGPGREHQQKHRAPLGRYAAHLGPRGDATIVNPGRLGKQASVDLCGQCHGQRLPKPLERITAWMDSGPTFRAGNSLQDHVTPVSIATPSPKAEVPDVFKLRFYADGTPRLTAYEYQGVTSSRCFTAGPLTCNSCHTMHGGDVHGQIEPRMRGNAACTQCHEAIGDDVAAHTKHAPSSSGSSCLECHMPRIVYGILDVHRSHRIDSPDARRDAEAGRPNACTLCHLDRSPLWAADETARLWGRPKSTPTARPDAAPLTLPDAAASLLSGDAIQRAVFAKASGRTDSALPPRDKAALRVHLVTSLCDAYPSIRWLALQSLLALEAEHPVGLDAALARVDSTRVVEEQSARAMALFAEFGQKARGRLAPPPPGSLALPDFAPDLPAIRKLLNLQSKRVIAIGE